MKEFYTIPAQFGQDLYDLSIQEYGSVEAIFLLLEDNPALSLDTVLSPGQEVKFRFNPPLAAVPDTDSMNEFRTKLTQVNSGYEGAILADVAPINNSNYETPGLELDQYE